MDINIFQFSDRVLIIDRSNDPFIRAKTIAALEKHGFLFRVFDLLHKIPTDQYYVNLFRYHAGIKQLANLLISKPRKAPTAKLKRINKIRSITSRFLVASNSVYKPISADLLISILNDTDALAKLSIEALKRNVIDADLEITNDSLARQKLITAIRNIKSERLFDATPLNGVTLDEMDLSVFVHCDVPIFLYCPDTSQAPELTDSLLRNYLKSALKVDKYKLTNEDKSGLNELIAEISSFTMLPIKHNHIAVQGSLHSLMA